MLGKGMRHVNFLPAAKAPRERVAHQGLRVVCGSQPTSLDSWLWLLDVGERVRLPPAHHVPPQERHG